jgi:hypothetical protein
MHARAFVPVLAAAALAGSAVAARADLVVNGGFEDGFGFPGWSTVDASSGSNYFVDFFWPNNGFFHASFGAVVGIPDEIFQVVPTTAGATYDVEFWVRNNGIGTDYLQVLWEGTPLLTQQPVTVSPDDAYHPFSFVVTAANSGSELRFRAFDSNQYVLIDDVSVTVQAASTPEPGTIALFALGAAGLGGLAWRRRKARIAAK